MGARVVTEGAWKTTIELYDLSCTGHWFFFQKNEIACYNKIYSCNDK